MIEAGAFAFVYLSHFSSVQRSKSSDVAPVLDAGEEGCMGGFDPGRRRRDDPGGRGSVIRRTQPELLEYEDGDRVVSGHVVNSDLRTRACHDFAVIRS